MTDRDDNALITDATLRKDPIEPTDRNDPIAPTEATLPTEPIDRIELLLATLKIDPFERHERTDGCELFTEVEPTRHRRRPRPRDLGPVPRAKRPSRGVRAHSSTTTPTGSTRQRSATAFRNSAM